MEIRLEHPRWALLYTLVVLALVCLPVARLFPAEIAGLVVATIGAHLFLARRRPVLARLGSDGIHFCTRAYYRWDAIQDVWIRRRYGQVCLCFGLRHPGRLARILSRYYLLADFAILLDERSSSRIAECKHTFEQLGGIAVKTSPPPEFSSPSWLRIVEWSAGVMLAIVGLAMAVAAVFLSSGAPWAFGTWIIGPYIAALLLVIWWHYHHLARGLESAH